MAGSSMMRGCANTSNADKTEWLVLADVSPRAPMNYPEACGVLGASLGRRT